MMKRIVKNMVIAAFFMSLAPGCRPPAGPVAQVPGEGAARAVFDRQAYAQISPSRGRVFWIDSQASEVRFFLWRGGLLAAQGHNHVMTVSRMEGAVFLPADMLADEPRFDIVFPVAGIEVDPLPLREKIGGAFQTGITEEGVRKTRENMLGDQVLDAKRFPAIGLSAERVYGELPKLVLETVITMHGIKRRHLIPVTVNVQGDRLTAQGAFAIRQTRFGIEPFSALGGALYVQDPITVEFEITARTG